MLMDHGECVINGPVKAHRLRLRHPLPRLGGWFAVEQTLYNSRPPEDSKHMILLVQHGKLREITHHHHRQRVGNRIRRLNRHRFSPRAWQTGDRTVWFLQVQHALAHLFLYAAIAALISPSNGISRSSKSSFARPQPPKSAKTGRYSKSSFSMVKFTTR